MGRVKGTGEDDKGDSPEVCRTQRRGRREEFGGKDGIRMIKIVRPGILF